MAGFAVVAAELTDRGNRGTAGRAGNVDQQLTGHFILEIRNSPKQTVDIACGFNVLGFFTVKQRREHGHPADPHMLKCLDFLQDFRQLPAGETGNLAGIQAGVIVRNPDHERLDAVQLGGSLVDLLYLFKTVNRHHLRMRRNDLLQRRLRRLNQMADIPQADSILNHHQRFLVIDRDAPGEPQLH